MSFTATKSIDINGTPERIWEALTTPEQVKQYMFGADVVTDWQQGSPIVYRGMWDGKPFEDKGTILEISKPTLLRTSYYSPLSGKADAPENYAEVTYRVSREGGATWLTVSQSNIPNAEGQAQSEQNWGMTLDAIKAMIEG